jgi:hypothetical protein
MIKQSITSNFSRLILITFFGSCLFISCYKEPFYGCTVIVESQDQSKVEGAEVILTAIGDTFGMGLTNSKGEISFEFDNAAVFDVKASKGNNAEFGFIKLIDQENVKETIVLP